jgi:outer membrane protein assembly factor BamA
VIDRRLRARCSSPRAAVATLCLALLLTLSLLGPRAAAAQDLSCQPGDREVRALHFEGNHAFPATELASVLVTTPSSAASRLRIIGTRRCLDPEEFPRDVIRLQAYYRKRGYSSATVDTTVRPVATAGKLRIVDVTFRVAEGEPLRVDTIEVTGLAALPNAARIVRGFPLQKGGVFDRVALEAARDTILQRMHNSGYLRADALVRWNTDVERLTANAWVTVVPGPFTRIRSVVVNFDTTGGAKQHVPEAVVRHTLGVRAGDPYSAADIIQAQRALYQTDIYRRVEVHVDTVGLPDSLVTLVVGLREGDLHAARASAGWATLDCFRAQTDYTNRYFLPRAQRLELQARVSRIGIGRPLNGAEFLCPQARDDPFSDRLNYYLGATIAQPTFFRLKRVPSLTVFTSLASEYQAFRRQTMVGTTFSLSTLGASRRPSTISYQFEVGRTEADEVIFCAVFSACDRTARAALSGVHPLGAVGYSVVRDRTDNRLAPTSGSLQRLTLRHSSAFTGSDSSQRFNKAIADASWYLPLGTRAGLITHVQLGGLLGGAPQQERLFAGGPTTVRGFPQNALGPAVYLVKSIDTVRTATDTLFRVPSETRNPDRTIPTGGNTLVVGNIEVQLPSPVLPDLLQHAVFADAGEVWERGNPATAFRGLRVTPGAGVRVKSLFGVIRVDLGYNPYALRAGAAYVSQSTENGGRALYCVSPGNTLHVTGSTTGLAQQEETGSCPATFQPSTPRNFFRRLNPSIWIGNAF